MKFYRKEYRSTTPQPAKFPCLILVPNSWNDRGYRTLFKLWLYRTATSRTEIGDVKIADEKLMAPERAEVITDIKDRFLKLPKNQASLGQSIEYYQNIRRELPEDHIKILENLNDLTVKFELLSRFENLDVFRKSLIRSSEAEKIISAAYDTARNARNLNDDFEFTYSTRLRGADEHHVVNFSFSNQKNESFRTVVLVGKNGTGKTQYLGNIANSLCDTQEPGVFNPSRPLFSKVIAISFSMFDKFKIPQSTSSKQFSYKYIGYRQRDQLALPSTRDSRLRMAFTEIKKKGRIDQWFQFVSGVIELDYLYSILGIQSHFKPTDRLKQFDLIIMKRSNLLSSGQSIIIYIITELISDIQTDSIILYDEPETHLHPNAIARLVKALNEILRQYNSFAIIATHSPIVVQETPSRNVRVFDRIGNTPVIKPLAEESFGENLSRITDTIFNLNQIKEGYKEYFEEQLENKTVDQINKEFDNNLGLNALLYLNAVSPQKTKKK